MWTRIVAAWLVIIGIWLFTLSADASNEHESGACPGQSWSQKTGPDELWYKAVTACNDHPAEELNHSVFLQYYDWEGGHWEDWLIAFVGSSLNDDFYATSRYQDVLSYGGAACYRLRTHHFILEQRKFLYSEGVSYSPSQCY